MHRGLDAATCLAVVILVAGCSSHSNASHSEAVLTAGYDTLQGHRASPDPAAALAVARRTEQAWRRELANGSGRLRSSLSTICPWRNCELVSVRRRLRTISTWYRLRFNGHGNLPRRSSCGRTTIAALPTQRQRSSGVSTHGDVLTTTRRDGGSKAFTSKRETAATIPFLIVFNFWRGRSGGGGQWARSEPLYPFGHG